MLAFRILTSYDIPGDIRSKLPAIPPSSEYDVEMDPRRAEFNARKVLEQRRLYVSVKKQPSRDNVNKFSALISGESKMDPRVKSTSVEELSQQAHKSLNPVKQQELMKRRTKNEHVFDRLARNACGQTGCWRHSSIDNEPIDTLAHPMQLLLRAKDERIFTRVVIRKVNGIRGYVDGYVVAFDKHFNIILRDAVEEYEHVNISKNNDEDSGVVEEGQLVETIVPTTTTIRRVLPMVMIRGDNVVLITKTPIVTQNAEIISRGGTLSKHAIS